MTTIRLMDGSFCSALKDQGFDANQHKLWTGAANKLCPEKVFSAYNCFLEAGVDVITTNTYHSLIPLIKQYYPESTVDEFNEPAVSLLREALKEENVKLDRPITMLGSIGCYGAALRNASEYHGNYVDEDCIYQKMKNFYVDEISKLESYGLDQIIIETVPALLEVKAILEVIASTPSTFVISFSCKDGVHLRHGERLSDAVKLAVEQPNVAGVGVNCTSANHVSSLLRSINGLTDCREVFVYPNTNTGCRDDVNMDKLSEEAMAALFQEWISLGATVIGGCCGVTPELTMKMRQVLDSL